MKVKIGLETHVQLNTQSKAFCGCRNPVNLPEEPEPNTLVCDTCLKITKETFFSRKTYFYPDMSKNFQITQYEIPLSESGQVILEQKTKQKVRIRRVHMEEDPSKIVHVGGLGGKYTLLDYNRAGIPLIEIVTEPDFSSPEEARMFLTKLTTILEYLGVYDSTSKAVFKSDANISLAGGKRVEVKNITGTKEIEQALKFEIFRQQNILRRGGKIDQSTRTWDPETKTTRELRAKETEEDYGYIFEPDLTMIEIGQEKIEKMKVSLPELPDEKYVRFIKKYKLEPKIAEALVSELDLASLFEQVVLKVKPHLASTWIAGYLKKTLNYNELRFRDSGLKREWIISLLKMVEKESITDRNAELVIRKMVEDRKDPETVMRKHGIGKKLKKVLTDDISLKIESIIKNNPKAVQDYKSGENKALHFLVGLAMKETRGQVDANDIRKLILKMIKK
jgi:aspartyl-tRNA(Asn)/glutamyl-tRNA(Gln) amidotransferase subunit B